MSKNKITNYALNRLYLLVSQGMTSRGEMAKALRVSKSTFYRLLEKDELFAKNLARAELERDRMYVSEAKTSLLTLIKGSQVKEVKTRYDSEGKSSGYVEIVRDVPPSLDAIKFVLCNLDGENWKIKNTDDSANIGGTIEFKITEKLLDDGKTK